MAEVMLSFGSLFAGIGGFDLGLERVGMQCAWQVEIDPACNRVLERHWPGVRRYTDVRQEGAASLAAVDLICGGFPCQDLSTAGRRAGLVGARSGVFWEFMRIVGELAPRWVVIENVPGLLSSNGGRDLGAVLGALGQRGYGFAYRVLDAQHWGVAQRRRRLFIVGHLGAPWTAPAAVLFESESLCGDTASARAPTANGSCTSTQSIGAGSYPELPELAGPVLSEGSGTYRSANVGGEAGYYVVAPRAYAITTRAGQRMEPTSDTFIVQAVDVRNLQAGGEISGTLAAKESGGYSLNFINPVQTATGVRRFTPLECERLQGFPDGWTAGEADTARYRMLGNAVAVPVAQWIGTRLTDQHWRQEVEEDN